MVESKEIESRILQVLEGQPEGVEDQLLTVALKNVDERAKVEALNSLQNQNRVVFFINGRGQPVYKYQSEEQALRIKDLDQEDVLVYQTIEEGRDQGVQTSDLKAKLAPQGFTTVILNKILKKLEKKGLIKKIKSLQQKNKLVWMLAEVEPSTDVTGGLIGSDSFNLKQIEVIQERVAQYLKRQGPTSYRELALHVRQIGVLSPDIRDDDIRQIIQVLVFDSLLETVSSGSSFEATVFRLSSNKYPAPLCFSQVPCAHCPVRSACGPHNSVNPRGCQYLAEWLL